MRNVSFSSRRVKEEIKMSKFNPRPTVTALVLFMAVGLVTSMTVQRTATANTFEEQDPILDSNGVSAWSWNWNNLPDYTVDDCPGGSGKTILNKDGSIAFAGDKFDSERKSTHFTNSGSWAYVGDESGHRAYDLKWSASTDHMLLSSNGAVMSGRSGKCAVHGTRQ
jgi:hypothetical protein